MNFVTPTLVTLSSKQLLKVLKKVRAAATSHRTGKATPYWFNPEFGICDNAGAWTHYVLDLDPLKPTFVSWQHYSGDLTYPVPSPQARVKPSHKYQMTKDVWVDDYGDLRMGLLNHCIKILERSGT